MALQADVVIRGPVAGNDVVGMRACDANMKWLKSSIGGCLSKSMVPRAASGGGARPADMRGPGHL
jgi:hypothetical protein